MKIQLRWLPLLLSMVISSIVLFGGWFIYQSMALSNPLTEIVANIAEIEQSEVKLTRERVQIRVLLSNDASLREVMAQLHQQAKSYIAEREMDIEVLNPSSPELDAWWASALFAVAEAMETKQYSKIPQLLQALSEKDSGMHVAAEMDQANVYIRLNQGEYSKFIMLPRSPVQMGVWSNE